MGVKRRVSRREFFAKTEAGVCARYILTGDAPGAECRPPPSDGIIRLKEAIKAVSRDVKERISKIMCARGSQ